MTGRSSFSTLRNRMSPEAQDRARAKSEALESEMALAEVRRAMKLSQEELAAILQVGDWIGFWPTLGLLIFDSILGSVLLRTQSRAVWRRAFCCWTASSGSPRSTRRSLTAARCARWITWADLFAAGSSSTCALPLLRSRCRWKPCSRSTKTASCAPTSVRP